MRKNNKPKARVLIVEDSRIISLDLSQRLKKFGFDVSGIATNGIDGLKLAGKTLPDFVLMDIQLEGDMDGIELAKILRQKYDIPVIFISGISAKENMERAKKARPLGYLIKPYRNEQLEITLEMCNEIYQKEKKLIRQNKQLEEAQDKICELNKSLEKKVIERTKSLNKSKKALENAQDVAKLGSWEIDIATKNIKIATQTYKIFGIPKGIYDVQINKIPGLIRGDNWDSVCKIVNETIEKGKPGRFMNKITLPSGALFVMDCRCERVENDSGNLGKVVGTILDITDIILAEKELFINKERLEQALEVGNIAWWDWDYKTGRFDFHPKKAEMIGYKKEEFPPKIEAFFKLIHPDDHDFTMNVMQHHLSGATNIYETEYRLKTKSGDWKWFYDRGKIVERDENGSPVRIIGVVTDISEWKNTLNELIQAKEKAEAANRLKSAFLATMSHELRTPLNTILGFSEMLLEADSLGEVCKNAKTIIKSGNELLEIIKDILELSVLESDEIKLNRTC